MVIFVKYFVYSRCSINTCGLLSFLSILLYHLGFPSYHSAQEHIILSKLFIPNSSRFRWRKDLWPQKEVGAFLRAVGKNLLPLPWAVILHFRGRRVKVGLWWNLGTLMKSKCLAQARIMQGPESRLLIQSLCSHLPGPSCAQMRRCVKSPWHHKYLPLPFPMSHTVWERDWSPLWEMSSFVRIEYFLSRET